MQATITLRKAQLHSSTSALFSKTIGVGPINWPALALARFILSFIVVAGHTLEFTTTPGPLVWISRFDSFNAIIGFLLISGLSIGKSILKDRDGYYLRRMQRIYPVYLVSIAFQYVALPQPISFKYLVVLLTNIFFLNQLLTSTSYVGPAWTLALEVWLYALAPVFLRLSYKQLVLLIGVSFGGYVCYTCGRTLFHWPYYSGIAYGLSLFFLSFIWIAGFLLAAFDKKLKNTSLLIALLFIGHFALTWLIQIAFRVKNHQLNSIFTKDAIDFILGGICLLCIYYVAISNRRLPIFSKTAKKLFDFLGNISYPLYLSHTTVLLLCKNRHIDNWAVLTGYCLAVATLIYLLFDFYSKKRTA